MLESSVGKTKNTKNGYIYEFLLSKLALGHTKNIKWTNQHAPPSQPLRSYNISSCPKHSRKSTDTQTPWYHISNRILRIPMKKIKFNAMEITSHGRDHAELSVLAYPEYLIIFYHRKISLCDNFPGSCFSLSRNHKVPIPTTFHNWKYLLLRYLLVLYILTKTGECWIS